MCKRLTDDTAIAAPRLPPAFIPSTNGSARGLWKRACINNPLTERAIPASKAVIAFGSLNFNIISLYAGENNSFIGMLTEPIARLMKKATDKISKPDKYNFIFSSSIINLIV
jgi:hypothetical protein